MATIPIVAAVKDFDKLTRELAAAKEAHKAARAEAKALKDTHDQMATGGALAKMAKDAGAFALGLVGANSAASVAQKIIAAAKEDFRQLADMQRGAANAQQTLVDAGGQFIANNPELTPAQVADWMKFAEDQGAQLGAGGAVRVVQAATALRNRTPGMTEEAQRAALEVGVKEARLDPATNIATFAAATLKIQESLGVSMQQAANTLSMFGARAGGDVATLADEVGKLKATAATTGTPLDKVLSLFGFLTAEGDDPTGKETSTVLRTLLARVNTRELQLGGRRVQFAEGMDAADKLEDVITRIQGGAFGDPQKAFVELTGELGRQSASMLSAVGLIGTAPQRLAETKAMVAEAGTTDVDLQARQLATKAVVFAPAASQARTKAAGGQAERAMTADEIGAEWERVRERMGAVEGKPGFLQQYGITTGFDWGKDAREMMGMYSGQNPLEWEQAERRRLLGGKLRGMLPTGASGYASAPGAGVSATEAAAANPFAGMTEEEMLRAALARGAVSMEGGLSTAEKAVLNEVGMSAETMTRLNQMWLDGLTKEVVPAFAEALRAAMAAPQPGPSALNPEG